jgi:orotate phosphoribosyltransferase
MSLDYQVMDQDYKKALLDTLYTRSFKFDAEKGFTLSSGQKSDVYIDCKKTVLSAEGLEGVGYAFFHELKLEPIDGIGGMTLGADPIAYAAALIRKEPKKHGTQQWVETNLQPGAWVCIVEDVITTGASTIKAVQRAREYGFQVRRVLALVDREEGGKENIQNEAKVKVDALFTKTDFIELHTREQKLKDVAEKKAAQKQEQKPVF